VSTGFVNDDEAGEEEGQELAGRAGWSHPMPAAAPTAAAGGMGGAAADDDDSSDEDMGVTFSRGRQQRRSAAGSMKEEASQAAADKGSKKKIKVKLSGLGGKGGGGGVKGELGAAVSHLEGHGLDSTSSGGAGARGPQDKWLADAAVVLRDPPMMQLLAMEVVEELHK
jgi:hypothetical protein